MKLKNTLLLLILFFNVSIVFSQNGYAYYKKQLSYVDDKSKNEYMKQALKHLKTQEYELSFHKNNALFKKVEALSVENNPVVEAFTKSISGFSGEAYFDRAKKTIIHKKEFAGSSFLILKKNTNWVLTRETLKIDNYLCYKATTTTSIENSEGIHEVVVIAWYAPEISLPYGPDGYGELPGLILKLENNGIITTLSKIEFLNAKTIEISPPTKGQEITEEAFSEMVKKRFQNRKGDSN